MTFTTTHAHRHDPDTSVQAARSMQGVAERHKPIIATVLLFWGPLTSGEIAAKCELNYLQVARRMSDLVVDGKVLDGGERRRSPGGRRAAVWVLK
jgi:predicted ArsR family transcriptional regulator